MRKHVSKVLLRWFKYFLLKTRKSHVYKYVKSGSVQFTRASACANNSVCCMLLIDSQRDEIHICHPRLNNIGKNKHE